MLWLLCFLPMAEPLTDHADVVEVNWVYGVGETQPGLKQLIWWNWDYDDYQVVDWRLQEQTGWPKREGEYFVSRWYDDKAKATRVVKAKVYRETASNYDREIKNREVLLECKRRKLRTN